MEKMPAGIGLGRRTSERPGGDGAEVLKAVARIEEVTRRSPNDIVIVRGNGSRSPAAVYDYVFQGDRIVLSGQGTAVGIRYRGSGVIKSIGAEQLSEIVFLKQTVPSFVDGFWRLVDRLSYFWEAGKRPVGQLNQARDPTVTAVHDEPLGELSPVFASQQLFSRKRRMIVPAWQGAAARITFSVNQQIIYRALVINKSATRVFIEPSVSLVVIKVLTPAAVVLLSM